MHKKVKTASVDPAVDISVIQDTEQESLQVRLIFHEWNKHIFIVSNNFDHGSPYRSIPVYRLIVKTISTKSYRAYRHMVHESVPMYCLYRSPIRPVCTTHTKRYIAIW